ICDNMAIFTFTFGVPWWYSYTHVFCRFSVRIFAHPMLTTWRFKMLLITEIHKRTKSLFYFKNDICAISTISAGRTTICDIFFSSEGDHSVSTVAAFNVSFYVIDKNCFFLLSPLVSMS